MRVNISISEDYLRELDEQADDGPRTRSGQIKELIKREKQRKDRRRKGDKNGKK